MTCFHFFSQVIVVEARGLKSLPPMKIVYCTMEVNNDFTDFAKKKRERKKKN